MNIVKEIFTDKKFENFDCFLNYFLENNENKCVQKIKLSNKNDEEEIYLDLNHLIKKIDFFYNNEKLSNTNFILDSFKHKKEKQLKIVSENKTFYLSNLNAEFKCTSCNKTVSKKGKNVINIFRSKALLCKNCMLFACHSVDSYNINFKKTMTEKYGYDSPIKVPEINKKMQNTMKEKYGVNYSAQSKDIRKKYNSTMLLKYGKLAVSKGWKNNKNNFSKIEKYFLDKIYSLLEKYNFKDIYYYKNKQYFINSQNKNYSIDFFIKDIGYGIEIDGDFWHGNLDKFDKDKIHPVLKISFEELQKIHEKRIEIIKNYKTIKFIRNIWTSEIESDENKMIDLIINDIERFTNE